MENNIFRLSVLVSGVMICSKLKTLPAGFHFVIKKKKHILPIIMGFYCKKKIQAADKTLGQCFLKELNVH